MDVVTALHAAAAVLLVIAGAAKLGRPESTAEMIAALGLRVPTTGVRAFGAAEMALGLAALALGGPAVAAATGAVYALFALVVVRAIAVGAASCGCFGRADTPPSWIHVAVNGAFSVASFGAAIADNTPVEVMEGQPGAGLPFVLLVGVIAGLALTALTALPEALAARRPRSAGAPRFSIGGSDDGAVTR